MHLILLWLLLIFHLLNGIHVQCILNEAHTFIFPRPKYLHPVFDIAIFQISNFPPYLILLFYYIGVHSLLYACIDVVNPLTTYDCHLSFDITM